jgi:Mlc titration factor MtfA (ptsG expression regulator)
VVHEIEEERVGEAWPQGPVVLSWSGGDTPDPDDINVVIHEFAHKLDLINGVANGMPPLHSDMSRDHWTAAFTRAYDDFVARTDRGEPLPFDEYAATDPGEFFAVASEVFLTAPDRVRDAYPRVYTQLCAFYRQHPHTG